MLLYSFLLLPVADRGGGGRGGHGPPSPVQISHKKDGHQRRPHRFHVSWAPPPYAAAGSDADFILGATHIYPSDTTVLDIG